jgi:amidase
MDAILEQDAGVQAALIAAGELSVKELMQATLARIEAVNGRANAIVSLRPSDELLAEAEAMDNAAISGPLHGLPVAIKDLADVAGLPTSEGSPVFAGQIARTDSLHVARMRAAGVIFIGKTNTPEFGLGSHTFNPVHGATANAYDSKLSAGGSSGGAAVALAQGMLAIADGSDMMGSLRNPAGWNNVYGFRPSWGWVPATSEGEIFLHQLSTNGPMARSPSDLALLLNVMAGPDPRQPNTMAKEWISSPSSEVAGKRIGWLGDWGGAYAMEEDILALSEEALRVFEGLGCEVEPVKPPFSREALWESWIILRSWAVAAGLAPIWENEATRGQLKEDAIWEIERGRALSAMQVHAASVIRSDWFRAAAALFEHYDALVLPTAQVWPFPVEWTSPKEIDGQGMDTYHRWMEVVIPASLIGLPALAVPAGFGNNGLPMGLQLIGRRGDDAGLLHLAQGYHQATRWPEQRRPD